VSEDQLDRLQQEENARRYFESGHADLQELQKLCTANREDDENPTGYGNGLDREPSSHPATGSRRQDSEDNRGLEWADGNQKHHDRRSGKFDDTPHLILKNLVHGTRGQIPRRQQRVGGHSDCPIGL
jgi:hypothetical protein